jgi:hypothetical protein
VPFTEAEVKSVKVNDKHWKFRRRPGNRRKK